MARNGNKGTATSAASVRQRVGRRRNTADVTQERLIRDIERGCKYFYGNRPNLQRPEPLFRT